MSCKYDRAITVFSPDGHLLQVEYAQQAICKGSLAIGVRGGDVVVLGAEKRIVEMLQTERTVNKISVIDDHICMTFAGVTADARIIMNRARVECKAYKLTVEDQAPIEYIARFIANLKLKYTQKNGIRPFGISCLFAGFDDSGKSHIYQTEPSGVFYECKATAIGQNAKTVLCFLEKHYRPMDVVTERGAVKLAMRAMLKVVLPDSDNLEIVVLRHGKPLSILSTDEIEAYINEIDTDKKEEQELQKQGRIHLF